MNRISPDDDGVMALLDRLVCDELSPGQRRDLLQWLESEPTRWRKCALAFLEAQVWRNALKLESMAPSAVQQVVQSAAASRKKSGTWLAIAASAFLAFSCGWGGSEWLSRSQIGRDQMALRPGLIASRQSSDAADFVGAEIRRPEDQPKTQIASFSLVGSDSKTPTSELKVPVPVNGAGYSAAPDVVFSEYERQKWERQGLRVSKVREYAPGRLSDGKPVLLSVDRVRVERIKVPTI